MWIFLEEPEDEGEFNSDHNTSDRDVAPLEGRADAASTLPPNGTRSVQNYRPDWATVYEALQAPGDVGHIDQLLDKNKRLSRQLKAIVDMLKPQQRRRVRYQQEGDDLDLDVAIRAAIDFRIGSTPDTRIHQSHVRDGRDISVLLLLGSVGIDQRCA